MVVIHIKLKIKNLVPNISSLEITVHDYGKTMQEQIDDAKAAVQKINNEEKNNLNNNMDSKENKC